MNCKFAEQEKQLESFNVLKKTCKEREAKIVELRQMNTDMIVVDKKNQDRIKYLGRQLVSFTSLNDGLRSDINIKSKQIEKLKKETSSLKTKNKNITNEFEEKLRKIFNNIMDNKIGEKTSLK